MKFNVLIATLNEVKNLLISGGHQAVEGVVAPQMLGRAVAFYSRTIKSTMNLN